MTNPRISVLIAAYAPGPGLIRVVESLDGQTLPQGEFEVIVIDDGSPDDTFGVLEGIAAGRANWRVQRIENSGWPSRPRNIATSLATGEYVLFMDHDDTLYPDALRRLVEFAEEAGADLISPKESKSDDPWWGMPALVGGNAVDVKASAKINRLLPMVPHKAYRTAFLRENGISFPEGRRMLWEDVHFNVAAYARAGRVAVLADTPVYLWHGTESNNSSTYHATDVEYWDRLDDLLASIDVSLADYPVERRATIMHQYQGRILRRLGKALQEQDPSESREVITRAIALQEAYVPPEWDEGLGFFVRPTARLLRDGRPDLIREFQSWVRSISAKVDVTSAAWADGLLHLRYSCTWALAGGSPLRLKPDGEKLLLQPPRAVVAGLPGESWDVAGQMGAFSIAVGVRSRDDLVTWQLPATAKAEWDGGILRVNGDTRLDPLTAAGGAKPMPAVVWNFTTSARWGGVARVGPMRYRGPALPVLAYGGAGVVYANKAGNLSLDLAQQLRSVVADGGLAAGRPTGDPHGFVLPLPEVEVAGETVKDCTVDLSTGHGDVVTLPARLIGDAAGARLEVRGRPPTGTMGLAIHTSAATIAGRVALEFRPDGQIVVRPSGQSTSWGRSLKRWRAWLQHRVLRALGR